MVTNCGLNSNADRGLVLKLVKSFYVDDVITGAENEASTLQLYRSSKEIMRSGGFNLRKFRSNSSLVQRQIDADEVLVQNNHSYVEESDETSRETTLADGHGITSGETKVLGVSWDPTSDDLILDLSDLATEVPSLQPTKRYVVSFIGKFYDPLGLLAPW